MENLKNDIKTGQFKNMYLLTGEEVYLKLQYAKKLQDALIPPDDKVNLNCYEGKVSVQELIDQAETLPFFAERRLLVVKDSGLFVSSGEQLAEYLEHVPQTTCFMFVESEVNGRQKLYNTVKKNGRAVEFKRQREDVLVRWILGVLKQRNKNITRNAMQLFRQRTGDDMYTIRNEMNKLLAYTLDRDAITVEDVETICTARVEDKIFDMIGAMASGEHKRAVELYCDLLTLDEPPVRILVLITRQFNQLLQVKELRSHGYDVMSIAEKLNMKDFIARNNVRRAEHFTSEKLMSLVRQCIWTEEAIKTGKLNARIGVEMLLAGK